MGRLVCLVAAVGLFVMATGGQATAALPSDVARWPVIRAGCADDLARREHARQAVREARERHGARLAAMLADGRSARGAEAIVQADAMLAHIGTEADAVLVAHGACATDEVLRRSLSAMETVAGLAPPAVAAAEATPRPTARPTVRPTPRPTERVVAASRPRTRSNATPTPRPSPTPRPTPRPTATPRPTPKPTATAAPTFRIVAPSIVPQPTPRPTPRPTPKR